jgi:hypothetical protein
MVPGTFQAFFLGVTGASGALVGLLFVAVSLAPERLVGPDAPLSQQLRASTALTALFSPLVVSLIALIPDTNVGWPCLVIGSIGVLFVAATVRRLIGSEHDRRSRRGSLTVLLGFLVVMILLIEAGVRLLVTEHDSGPLSTVAGAIIASLGIGVNRSWELVGASDSGMTASFKVLLFGDKNSPPK